MTKSCWLFLYWPLGSGLSLQLGSVQTLFLPSRRWKLVVIWWKAVMKLPSVILRIQNMVLVWPLSFLCSWICWQSLDKPLKLKEKYLEIAKRQHHQIPSVTSFYSCRGLIRLEESSCICPHATDEGARRGAEVTKSYLVVEKGLKFWFHARWVTSKRHCYSLLFLCKVYFLFPSKVPTLAWKEKFPSGNQAWSEWAFLTAPSLSCLTKFPLQEIFSRDFPSSESLNLGLFPRVRSEASRTGKGM